MLVRARKMHVQEWRHDPGMIRAACAHAYACEHVAFVSMFEYIVVSTSPTVLFDFQLMIANRIWVSITIT